MTEKNQTLDMAQLLGFADVTGEVDMAAPELAARMGAKFGEPDIRPPEPVIEPLDNAQLFGFETIAAELDFRDPAVASQVGAKFGEPTKPAA